MSKVYSLEELASKTGSILNGDKSYSISGVNTLDQASSDEASFLANLRYEEAMKQSKAGVICIGKTITPFPGKNFLISDDPSRTFQMLVEIFSSDESSFSGFSDIHTTAVIHKTAIIGKNVQIGPYAVIDKGVTVKDHTYIGSHVFIGPESQIGENCILHPTSVVREKCILHNRVILQPGAIIGSCGFGFTSNAQGEFQKIDQKGIVVLEDDVEIGANTTIDRARFKETRVSKGSKIDNLVQIAHNVEIGPHNGIAAQTGIAGSSKTGKHVLMGGQVGITGHVEIGDYVMLATRTGVSKSLASGKKFRGTPATDLSSYNRQKVHIRKLDSYVQRIKELERKIQALENPEK